MRAPLHVIRRSAMSRSLILILGAAALLAAGCGGGSSRPAAQDAGSPLPVRAETAARQDWGSGLELTAGVLPMKRAMPGTVLLGRVEQILHREGDRVKSGAVLARVESREVSARLAQAEAGVTAARAMEENARRMKERMERLSEKQAASRKNLEDATAGYEAAAANRKAAEEGAQAARMYVSYSEVKAPFDGLIVERRIEAGDTAAPGMPLFTIEDISKVKIEAAVPESLAVGLAPGRPVEVEIASAGGAARPATIAEILPDADPRSRTVTVRIVIDNPDGEIRSGMFARVRVPAHVPTGSGAATALTVPDAALVRQGPLVGVFIVDGSNIARLRWVTAGETRAGRIEIQTGLVAGERFVLDPPAGLSDGRRVEVK